ncbi:MAG: hypothetical protein JNK58_01600 [Phycisphaerae bacterium]|nr:hypothetical protein [Phycisphaerae bacterium]
MGALFLLVALVLSAAGVSLVGWGLVLWLELVLGLPGALAVTGALSLLIAGVCVWTFSKINNS